ncbi:MAG: cell division protein ZapA [Candidatus Marinimicrobia bacterium]|nr:cell division protein ZapA [Candidatus Neomarinimicrobiota bacterium]
MSSSNVVKVNILGQEYVIRTSADPAYIKEVAAYMNEKMDELIASGIDANSQQLKIAVLAGMNITDELFAQKENQKKLIDTVEAKTLAISEFVEGKIDEMESGKS